MVVPSSASAKSTMISTSSGTIRDRSPGAPRKVTVSFSVIRSTCIPSGTLTARILVTTNSLTPRLLNWMVALASVMLDRLVTPSGRAMGKVMLWDFSSTFRSILPRVMLSPNSASTASPPDRRMVAGSMVIWVFPALAPPP